jgi:large conductance mechanosensitive channel
MSIVKEFKEFAVRGNVLDLAVGIVIGAAFGKIVTSFVNDILMPPLGVILGGVNFNDLKLVLKASAMDVAGKPTPPVTLNYGSFIQAIIDFLIIAFGVFLMIKGINRFRKKEALKPEQQVLPGREELLLQEIRDILKAKTDSIH